LTSSHAKEQAWLTVTCSTAS